MAYASGTTVTSAKTQGEIMGLLGGRGVTKIATMQDEVKRIFSLAFEHECVPYRMTLPLPDPSDQRFTHHARGQRTESAAAEEYRKEVDRRWRAFGMVIKAKIVAVEEGISTMQAEFIGNAILSNGMTVAETHAPELAQLAAIGRLPSLALPGGGLAMITVTRLYKLAGIDRAPEILVTEEELARIVDLGSQALQPAKIYGRCSRCGCTEMSACVDERGPCAWANEEQTLCTHCLTPMERTILEASRASFDLDEAVDALENRQSPLVEMVNGTPLVDPMRSPLVVLEDLDTAPANSETEALIVKPDEDLVRIFGFHQPEPEPEDLQPVAALDIHPPLGAVNKQPEPSAQGTEETVAGVPRWRAEKLTEHFRAKVTQGSNPKEALYAARNYAVGKGLSIITIREVLRAMGCDVPEPIDKAESTRRARESRYAKKAVEPAPEPQAKLEDHIEANKATNGAIDDLPEEARRFVRNQTKQKFSASDNAHLTKPQRKTVPVSLPKPVDRVPPPPDKAKAEPQRPKTVCNGLDHLETEQLIRMLIRNMGAHEIVHEFRGQRIGERLTLSSVQVFINANTEWLKWLMDQPPFRVNEVLVDLRSALAPLPEAKSVRPVAHVEEAV